jgi:hypothetical protein
MMILKQGNNRAKRTNCIIKDPAIKAGSTIVVYWCYLPVSYIKLLKDRSYIPLHRFAGESAAI